MGGRMAVPGLLLPELIHLSGQPAHFSRFNVETMS